MGRSAEYRLRDGKRYDAEMIRMAEAWFKEGQKVRLCSQSQPLTTCFPTPLGRVRTRS
jgi:hypothetical protein